ncbi:phage head-tail connector protein [Clostridium massiliamazoniense]|uniref:phage head-tail connector protein n=1 Tax=Clostridium massiliamazoniense TaxID=1347366 RepID=UPI0006D7D6A7|nr:phage head-tail connector protein [Clostridium massiliamazoniense]
MLDTLLLLLNIDKNDVRANEILKYYINKATQYFLSETNLTIVPTSAGDIIIELVILMWNKMGSEGIYSEYHNGIIYKWKRDISARLRRQILSYRVITW